MKAVYISGGFDPIHEGHLDYLQAASKLGKVFVLLNSDEWLIRKKGYCFQPWETRARIIRAMGYSAYGVDDSDGTVCEGLRAIPTALRQGFSGVIFAKGGDRTAGNTPEQEVCKQLGIEVIFGVGGDKVASSSELVAAVREGYGCLGGPYVVSAKPTGTPMIYEDAR